MNLFEERLKKLHEVRTNLKNYFVGLDKVIDDVFLNIETWYVYPELLTRPTIINLWGLTGTGKTDLVRRLAKDLDMESQFLEIQLEKKTNSSYDDRSLQSKLESSKIQPNCSGILLLDEVQRFRSIDEKGMFVENSAYPDIWTLLSDGKFSDFNFKKENLHLYLFRMLYDKDGEENENNESSEEKVAIVPKSSSKRKYRSSVWYAEEFKKATNSKLSIEQIMLLSIDEKIDIVREQISLLENKKYEGESYSKLLIFICGNLDEAYTMSSSVSETNVDADILHEFSNRISILKIKDCLVNKFKPEQIARFGNIHIIYPSLSKKNYQTIITKKLDSIKDSIQSKYSIKINFSEKIKELLYRNGVYPLQGVRPVYSTISSIIENSIPYFLSKIIDKNIKSLDIDIDEETNSLFAFIEKNKISKKIILNLTDLEKTINKNVFVATAIHEVGHAIVYSLLYNTVPKQINVFCVGETSSGFIFPHDSYPSKDSILKSIVVFYAGLVAEEIVLGEKNKSTGAASDIIKATERAVSYVRSYNMDGYHGNIAVPGTEISSFRLTNHEETNKIIEEILGEQKKKAVDLINLNKDFFKDVLDIALKNKKISQKEFYDIAKKYISPLIILEESDIIIEDFSSIVNKFLN